MNREEGPIVASFRFCFFFLGRLRYIICSNLSTAAFTSPNEAIKAVRLKKNNNQSVSQPFGPCVALGLALCTTLGCA